MPWSKPADIAGTSVSDPSLGTGSLHPGGLNAAMVDGSVRFVKNSKENPINPRVLQGLVTRNGGEIVNLP